jgi:hypothetical protein
MDRIKEVRSLSPAPAFTVVFPGAQAPRIRDCRITCFSTSPGSIQNMTGNFLFLLFA